VNDPERLAYWYFRLNGFLTTENFVVHPDAGSDQRTDADLLAVRFRHRQELLSNPMEDDPSVTTCAELINAVIAEVKRGPCALNGPWTRPGSQNMQRVIRSLGLVPPGQEIQASQELYERGRWSARDVSIRLFAVGETANANLFIPLNQQLTWSQIIDFCKRRFGTYREIKLSVGQWAEDGRQLRTMAISSDAEQAIRRLFKLLPLASR
jgi:hypothetical protein